MKRTVIPVTIATGAMLIGPTALANAAQTHHHKSKAERVHDRREARRAAKAAPKPAQGLTAAHPAAESHGDRTQEFATPGDRSIGPCAVTSDRAGSSFTVHNGCDTTQAVTVSVQSQPGPWHRGLCTAGGCHLITRYDVQVPPGTHTITVATGGGCWVQVDLKWRGRLIKSNHYVNRCDPVKPKPPVHPWKPVPPVVTPAPPTSHIDGHVSGPDGQLPRTGAPSDAGIYGAAGLGLLLLGSGLTVAGRKRSA